MTAPPNPLSRRISPVTRLFAVLCGLWLPGCSLLVRVDIVSRRYLGVPLQGTDEIGGYTLAVLAALRGWAELDDSILFMSVSNSPLRVPLWFPQGAWVAGLVTFAAVAVLQALHAARHAGQRFGRAKACQEAHEPQHQDQRAGRRLGKAEARKHFLRRQPAIGLHGILRDIGGHRVDQRRPVMLRAAMPGYGESAWREMADDARGDDGQRKGQVQEEQGQEGEARQHPGRPALERAAPDAEDGLDHQHQHRAF